MFIKPTKNFGAPVCDIWEPRIELDDLKPVVHTCHKQVVLTVPRWVPFYTPSTAPNMSLLERSEGFTCVKEANLFVVAGRESVRRLHLEKSWQVTFPRLRDIQCAGEPESW